MSRANPIIDIQIQASDLVEIVAQPLIAEVGFAAGEQMKER